MNCTLCHTLLIDKIDHEYYTCSICNAYVKDEELYYDKEKEKSHYECHNNDVNDLGYQKFTAPVTQTILEYCTPEMLGLDYGCGKGPVITHQLIERGYQVDLYDLYFYPDTVYLTKKYDYIFSCEVFEHFYNPQAELTKLSKLLNTDGLLIVKTHLYEGTIDFKNWYYRKDLTHVFIYTEQTFKYIAEYFNFEIITLTERLIVLKKK